MELLIRRAVREDLPRLTAIYNQAIQDGNCTCDTEIFTVQEREGWFFGHQEEKYPILVCQVDGYVAGYGYLTPYRPGRQAVAHVAEISYYLDFAYHRQGLGSRLMETLMKYAKDHGITVLLTFLLGSNRASIGLLTKYGFSQWGCFPAVVSLGGGEIDHVVYGRRLLDDGPVAKKN